MSNNDNLISRWSQINMNVIIVIYVAPRWIDIIENVKWWHFIASLVQRSGTGNQHCDWFFRSSSYHHIIIMIFINININIFINININIIIIIIIRFWLCLCGTIWTTAASSPSHRSNIVTSHMSHTHVYHSSHSSLLTVSQVQHWHLLFVTSHGSQLTQ